MESVPTLIVVPARAENAEEIEPLLQTLVSVTATAPGAMVLVVDDRSPAPQAQMIEVASAELDCAYVLQQDGEGAPPRSTSASRSPPSTAWTSASSRPASCSTRRAGSTACAPARAPTARPPRSPAARSWSPRARSARPATSSRASAAAGARGCATSPRSCSTSTSRCCARSAASCSSSASEWIERVGLYDELLTGPHAALDYCIRVCEAGGQCVLEPTVRGRALEHADGDPDEAAATSSRLRLKHADVNFYRWTPEVI